MSTSHQEKVNAIRLLGTGVYAVIHKLVPVLEECGLCGGNGKLVGADCRTRTCPLCNSGAVTIGYSTTYYVYGTTRLRQVTIEDGAYFIRYNVSDDLGGYLGHDSDHVFQSLDDAVEKVRNLTGKPDVLYVRYKFRPCLGKSVPNIDDPACRTIINVENLDGGSDANQASR